MSFDSRSACDGPRYALAIYDGNKNVGFLPLQGNSPVDESDNVALDLFYSELGVRSQARRRALEFAPLTVAPYDLCEHRPLDQIFDQEDQTMPLKDEEHRDISTCDSAMAAGRIPVNLVPQSATFRVSDRRGNLEDLTSAVKLLAKAQRRLAQIVARLVPGSED